MGRNTLTYRCEYTNGIVTYKHFHSKKAAKVWAHNEGDHLVGFERIV